MKKLGFYGILFSMKNFKDYLIATRPWSFSMTFFSVTLGTILASYDGSVNYLYYFLCLLGMVFFHAAGNLANDYFDFKMNVDKPDSPTCHYRPHPIITEKFKPHEILAFSGILFFLSLIIGFFFSIKVSYIIFLFGAIGFLIAFSYSGIPFHFKYKALGEFPIFLVWGPFMVGGSYLVQRGNLPLKVLLISIPFGILVSLVLFANNLRDIDYDKRQGIKTIGVILGKKAGLNLYLFFIILSYVSLILLVIFKILSPFALLVFLSLPKAYKLYKQFIVRVPEGADAITAQLSTSFGLLLIFGIFLHKILFL